MGSPQQFKVNSQLRGARGIDSKRDVLAVLQSPAMTSSSKVKKIKTNQLNLNQINQIYPSTEKKQHHKANAPSSMTMTPTSGPGHLIISQQGSEPAPPGSQSRNTHYVQQFNLSMYAGQAQRTIQGQQQQTYEPIQQHGAQIPPQSFIQQQQMPVFVPHQGLTASQQSQQPQKFASPNHTQGRQSKQFMQVQNRNCGRNIETQEVNINVGSTQDHKHQQQSAMNYYSRQGIPQSPSMAAQLEQDGKLGRKGERPTVAQILEIGDQSWIDSERGPVQPQQPLSRITLNSVHNGNPVFNATVTSNFDSIGRSSFHNQSNIKKQKNQKGLSMDYACSPQQLKVNSPNQVSLSQQQFRHMHKTQIQKQEAENPVHQQHMDMMQASSSLNIPDQILNNTTAAATHSRQGRRKIHYTDSARLQNMNPHQYQQQQPAAAFIPLFVDVNSRNATHAQGGTQDQLYRVQEQFLPQATIIRHPQMGELPVIQMTQQQLNAMVQQAAQAQQRQNFQGQQQHNGATPATSSFHTMAQILAAQGLPINSQMAFAIQVQEQLSPAKHSNTSGGHIGPQMSPQGFSHTIPSHSHYQQHMQMQQHCQLPSLRQPVNHVMHHQVGHQAANQTLTHPNSPNQFHQLMSQAPIKKMKLNSRGKSVPRQSAQQTDPSDSGHSSRGQHHQNSPLINQPPTQYQRQQFQHFAHHQTTYPVSNRIGNFFFQEHSTHQKPVKNNTGRQLYQQLNGTSTSLPSHLAPLHDKSHSKQNSYINYNQRESQAQRFSQMQDVHHMQMYDKDQRNSMQFAKIPDSAKGHNRDRSQMQNLDTASKQNYVKLNMSATTSRQSHGLVSQSDQGSDRSGKQCTVYGKIRNQSGLQPSGQQATSNSSKVPPGNVYVSYKHLSDILINTPQQNNMNLDALYNPNQSRTHLSNQKGRKISSKTVNTSQKSNGETHLENSSHQDMNGGIPYIFESQKINQAMVQEEMKMVKQHLSMTAPGCAPIIIGDLKDLESTPRQSEVAAQLDPKPKKKARGRKGGGFNTSHPHRQLIKSSGDAVKVGQRQFNQLGSATAASQHVATQDQRHISSVGVKEKKGKKVNHSLIHHSHAEQQLFLEQQQQQQQQQMLQQYHEDSFLAQHSGVTASPTNLKPKIQIKNSFGRKGQDLVQYQMPHQPQYAHNSQSPSGNVEIIQGPGNELSLIQHGLFTKQLAPACAKYYKSKNNTRMTPYKYKNGISNRLLVARETFTAKRAKLPILVVNIDGAMGYFDENKTYNCRERTIQALQSLSHNFKIVGFSQESKGLILRLGKILADHKTPFAFDAVYQIHRKPVQNQNRLNLTQIILDFSSEDEENLEMFVSSQILLVTVDKNKIKEKFETMDLREVFDYDKEYLQSAKAPLIIRLPHARCRPSQSTVFDALFQLLVCLLVSSKLGNMETTSLFTYNDRTKGLSIPTGDKGIIAALLPERMKLIDKVIQHSKSLRFVMNEPQHGLNFHKGFKQLSEVYRGSLKPDWIEFQYRVFKPLLPIRMRLQKITQIALQGAQPPTGKRWHVRCDTEDTTRRFQLLCKKNEITRKHIRKYRARYWAVNQIEDAGLDEDDEETQDIVGDLLTDALVATTLSEVVAEEPQSPSGQPLPPPSAAIKDDDGEEKDGLGPADVVKEPNQAVDGIEVTEAEEVKEGEKLGGGACSSSSEEASDSDNEHYDEQAQAVKFKVIDVKHVSDNEGGATMKRQPTIKSAETNKLIKIECRKIPKPKIQVLLEFFSKKQNSMMFTTTQAQHLQGAAALQIESQINELTQRLNDAEKTNKKDIQTKLELLRLNTNLDSY